MSAARTAYPSIAERSNGGRSTALRASSATIRPAASASATRSTGSGATRAATCSQASATSSSVAADPRHRARRLDEARLADVVLELLAPDRVAHDLLDLGVASRPSRSGARRSVSFMENRQVRSIPSAVRRMRLQSPQNGSVTGEMKPISPLPSANR